MTEKKWIDTDFGQEVSKHIKRGFKIFPLHGVDKNLKCTCGKETCGIDNRQAGKHPYAKTVPHGFQDATGDLAEAERLFEGREDLNIGIATGAASGLFVVDIDDKNAGRGSKSFDRIREKLGPLPDTMLVMTGNGFHLYFDYPAGEDLKNGTNSFGIEFPDIDTRGNGGYVVAPPSRHFSGRYYVESAFLNIFADIPPAYVAALQASKMKQKKDMAEIVHHPRVNVEREWSDEEMQEALSWLDADMPRDEWLYIGMALHDGGYSWTLWDEWSRSAKEKYIQGECNYLWRGFTVGGGRTLGTIIAMAKQKGWSPHSVISPEISARTEAMVAPLLQKIRDKEAGKEKSAPIKTDIKLAFDPLALPGPIGDTVRWIVKYAIYEQPELALLNTLAFAGAVFGRRYASPLNTRTNMYLVGISGTGSGKEHSCGMITKLAMDCRLSDYIGANNIRSEVGMLKSLTTRPSQLLMLDEFGMLMQALSDPRADVSKKAIIRIMTAIYSKSSSAHDHGEVANTNSQKLIVSSPNLCVYGTSTEQSYLPSLKRSAIVTGELNRFIVLPSFTNKPARRTVPFLEVQEGLFEWWTQFAPNGSSSLGVMAAFGNIVPTPTLVEWGACDDMQHAIRAEQDAICKAPSERRKATADLWGRLAENTIKIAMVFAIARNPDAPVFEKSDFDYAYSIVSSSIMYMESLAEKGMAETSHEAMHMEIVDAIKKAGSITRRNLIRKLRKYKMHEVENILVTAQEAGTVIADRNISSPGRPMVVYHYAEEKD